MSKLEIVILLLIGNWKFDIRNFKNNLLIFIFLILNFKF